METAQRVGLMTFAQRCRRLYLFGRSDLFADRSVIRKSNTLHDSATAYLEPAIVAPTESQKLAIDFFKSSVKVGDVISITQHAFDIAQSDQVPIADDYDHGSWMKLFKQKPISIADGSVFLEIIDSRPESKAQVKSSTRHASPHELSLDVWLSLPTSLHSQ